MLHGEYNVVKLLQYTGYVPAAVLLDKLNV